MNAEIIEKLMHDDRTEIVNMMVEYANLAQKYNKLISGITMLTAGKDFSEDVSVNDITEMMKRSLIE